MRITIESEARGRILRIRIGGRWEKPWCLRCAGAWLCDIGPISVTLIWSRMTWRKQ
jgi:hypothetical protein